MSIRTRLTLWYTAILATFLIVLSAVAYLTISFTLLNGTDALLRARGTEIITASEGLLVREGEFDISLPELDPFQKAGLYIQAWTVDGRLRKSSENLSGYTAPLDPSGMPTQQSRASDVNLTQFDEHLRVLTMPLAVEGQSAVVGYLQIGASLSGVDRAQQSLLIVLVPGSLLAILFAWLGGRLLASRALRPIDEIARTALQISRADDLSRRIEHAGPADEIGRLAEAFNHMLERLEGLFGAQRRFVADISHELRTPLTTIRANLDLIRRMGVDDLSLDAIQSESERMARLVGDLMLLVQLDAGEMPIHWEEVDLATLMLETFRQARVLAAGRVEVVLGEEDLVSIQGDPDRVRQLVLNLVDNAIKYTPRGGRVTLGLRNEGTQARFWVTDTGRGIPAADLPHIFDRFYRVDKARSRKGGGPGGAGLGLSIVHWITQAHGGRIQVESVEGSGTTFTVFLPVKHTGAPQAPAHL